jgi:serine/threonine protein kinase
MQQVMLRHTDAYPRAEAPLQLSQADVKEPQVMTERERFAADVASRLKDQVQQELGGEYIIERELGRGGMAVVFLAQDVQIGRKVAVKVLPPALVHGHGVEFVERFKREARTAGTLEHPNIIPIHRVSNDGKLFWYVMKYIDGEGLDQLLKRESQLSLRATSDILAPVADALDYAHRRGVIHRDIKPGNLLLDSDGKVTITDFGIAKAYLSDSLTVTGSILGTPYYMSPEQCAGKALTGAADQYSLAVMVYQMLSGHLPFTGESAVEIIKKHTLDPVPPITILRPGVPAHVAAAIQRALSKDPEDRFETVRHFLRDLEFASIERTDPLTPAERFATLSKSFRIPRPSGVVLASRVLPARMRPRWKVRMAAILAPLAPMVRPAQIAWSTLSRRTQIAASTILAVAVAAGALPAAWPASEVQAASDSLATATDSVGPKSRASNGATSLAARDRLGGPQSVLTLRVRPAGGIVRVDGKRITHGSDRIALGPGTHVVAVERAGYRVWTEEITASGGAPIERYVALTPMPTAASSSTSPQDPTTEAGSATTRVTNPAAPAGATIATLKTPVIAVPTALATQVLAEGYAATEMDVLSPECGRFVTLFWDVIGFEMDAARVCAALAVLNVRDSFPVRNDSIPARMLNFTRFVRTVDGAIEATEKPAVVAEWRNDASGKRIRFHLSGDSIVATDETPSVPIVRATTRKAKRAVSLRQVTEGSATTSVVRIDAFGLAVKTPYDSLPVVATATHNHRIGSCTGTITFGGSVIRYAPDRSSHEFVFRTSELQNGTVRGDRATIRFNGVENTERLTVRGWEPLFEALIVARSAAR